ncbi:hypothetical protein V7S43_007091 [Phytophthora oleae]|uniref:PiggyBac transposable element-derived protein domain-containing protein n=1 Tax=Phytophthora oleae TaxID=2107226 RepID=A0ABD3FM46_9STRA
MDAAEQTPAKPKQKLRQQALLLMMPGQRCVRPWKSTCGWDPVEVISDAREDAIDEELAAEEWRT